MNNLTDKEIIKALDCCFLSECACAECPYADMEICDTAKMIQATIDLINRQKAEIDELQHKISSCNSEIERLREKYKQLEAGSLIYKGGVDFFVKKAIERFAEILKSEDFETEIDANTVGYLYSAEDIDSIAKRMVGE